MTPKLPVYLLVDVSGSMKGEPIESVRNGIAALVGALRRDPYALKTARISVIAFGDEAKALAPLTKIGDFTPPEIQAEGGTALGAALKLVGERADAEVVVSPDKKTSDWRPLVFIMTDGYPTDSVESALKEFRRRSWGVVAACAVGDECDLETLRQIAYDPVKKQSNVVQLATTSQSDFEKYFNWVSASVSAKSRKVVESAPPDGELPPPPPEIRLV